MSRKAKKSAPRLSRSPGTREVKKMGRRSAAQTRLLHLALSSAHVGSWEWDIASDHIEWSELVGPLYGLPPGHTCDSAAAFVALVYEEDRAVVLQKLEQALRAGHANFGLEHRVLWADQELHWLEVRGLVHRNVRGEPVRMAGIVIDVTARKEAEAKVVASESLMRQLMDHMPVAISVSRLSDGLLLDVNRQFERLFGYTRADAMGSTTLEIGLWADAQERQRLVAAAREAGGAPTEDEVSLCTKDRRLLPMFVSAHPMEYDAELYMLCAYTDLTEQKRNEAERRALELQLQHAQRLEAVGRLAAGVAHDFNNVLSAITMSADLLREALAVEHPGMEDVNEIRKAADRAVRLVRQLLAFSRQQALEPRVLDLNQLLSNIELMLARLVGEDVEMSLGLAAELWSVKADPSQIEQVIVNLVVNARDAMARGGKLRIETGNVTFGDGHTVDHEPLASGDYVALCVSDTGAGMDTTTRTRMFEPFYTTKEHGRGTGLGLSTVYGIVRQSGGAIDVQSDPGSGTRITVFMPRVKAAIDATPKALTLESSGGSETILVVEDDAAVRQVTRKILVGLGYRVLDAASPRDATELVKVYVGSIDLLITDLVMPGTNGRELAAELLHLRPRLRVLYMSGHAREVAVHHGIMSEGSAFIQKPFVNAALANKVRALLDAD